MIVEGPVNAPGHGRLEADPVGRRPARAAHPLAHQPQACHGSPSDGVRRKRWIDFSGPQAPEP